MRRPSLEVFSVLGELVEDGCPDIELGNLSLKRSEHHLLTQALEAIYLRLHQWPVVVSTPALSIGYG